MKTKLVDMKMPKKSKDKLAVCCEGDSGYPYGLGISLNKDSIKKIGIGMKNITAGDTIKFVVQAQIIGTRIDAGEKELSYCDMQIIKMGILEE